MIDRACFCDRRWNEPFSEFCYECSRDKKVLLDALKEKNMRGASHDKIADVMLDFIRDWQKDSESTSTNEKENKE